MIVILDYGVGNVRSIANMLTKVGAASKISADPADICAADKLILPGVGAFDHVISAFRASSLVSAVEEKVGGGTPILGICVGMQMLGRGSEEGSLGGLGWIPGAVKRFDFNENQNLRVPHMGWNEVTAIRPHPLTAGLTVQHASRFYFAHSYHFVCDDPKNDLLTCDYGGTFTAACHRGNVFGVQFHPEKSHRFGMRLLGNFAKLDVTAQIATSSKVEA